METTKNNNQVIDSLNYFDSKGAQDILDYISKGGDTQDINSYGRYTELNPSKESNHDNFVLPTKYNDMSAEEMIIYFETRQRRLDRKNTLINRLISLFK